MMGVPDSNVLSNVDYAQVHVNSLEVLIMAIVDPGIRSEKGYDDKKEFTCVCCGKKVMLTKFASAKTAKCDDCKRNNVQPNADILASIGTVPKSKSGGAPTGDTKVCQCVKCGADVTVTKFASAAKVLCDECKVPGPRLNTDGNIQPIRIDLTKLNKDTLPALDEYYILPTIINNPRLREVKCQACGHEFMRILKILDGSDRGMIISYQCPECFTLTTISEQCDHIMSPQKPGHFFNYRGEEIESTIPAVLDTRIKNIMEKLYTAIADAGIYIEGITSPMFTRPYQKLIPYGFNTEEQTEVYIKTIDNVVKALRDSRREGADIDKPEGARYIKISDTCATEIANELCNIMKICKNKDLVNTDDGPIL
jgi:hypothetical protein